MYLVTSWCQIQQAEPSIDFTQSSDQTDLIINRINIQPSNALIGTSNY